MPPPDIQPLAPAPPRYTVYDESMGAKDAFCILPYKKANHWRVKKIWATLYALAIHRSSGMYRFRV